MYQFFVSPEAINETEHRVIISGDDFNHIKNVLRMKADEEISVSDGESDKEYRCRIESFTESEVICSLSFIKQSECELPSKVYLFQGLPKSDKMELIIQKAVELGVCEVIPVACHRSVVKLDEKKADKKTARWQQIAEAAAKQSKRAYIPAVKSVMSFKEALNYAKEKSVVQIVPYELFDADRMEETRSIFTQLKPGEDIAVFIGPEGGFEEKEIDACIASGAKTVTLGRRILRTETAGMTVLSFIVLMLEGKG